MRRRMTARMRTTRGNGGLIEWWDMLFWVSFFPLFAAKRACDCFDHKNAARHRAFFILFLLVSLSFTVASHSPAKSIPPYLTILPPRKSPEGEMLFSNRFTCIMSIARIFWARRHTHTLLG